MRSRIAETLALVAMLAVLAVVSYRMIHTEQQEDPVQVSVIVPGSQNERWKAVREGMQDAAEKYNMQVHFATTTQWISSNDLWSKAVEEKNGGADAIVLNPSQVSSENDSKMEELTGVPLLILNSDMPIEDNFLCVHSDDTRIGEMIGEALWNDYGESLKNMKIGLAAGVYSQSSMQQRQEGLRRVLNSHGVSIAWSLGLGESLEKTLIHQLTNPATETDLIVALGNLETETAVDAVRSTGRNIPIYGEGYSEKAVYYLDKKVIYCLVLPNDFSVGYYSIELLADSMGLAADTGKDREIEVYCVHSYDMYDEENQKIMFPLVQ